MKIELPIKPISINAAFQGRRYKTVACKDFERDAFRLLKKHHKIPGEVQIHYTFYLANHKMTDVSNVVKVLEDVLVKCGYFEDDRKVYYFTARKVPSDVNKIEVDILPLDNVLPVC